MTIYEQLLKAKIPLDNHESDLYALVTPESTDIVNQWEYKSTVTTFRSQIDNKLWYDLPFAYIPFWDKTEPIKTLTCCCCGGYTKGRQWWNRDNGYGLCGNCANFISEKESPENMQSYYGIKGIHYFSEVK